MSGAQTRRRGWPTVVWLALAALAALTAFALLCLMFAPHDPAARVGYPMAPPLFLFFLPPITISHWSDPGAPGVILGTDSAGRDLLSRLLIGLARTWLPSLAVVVASGGIGCLVGTLAGMTTGWLGRLMHIPINLLRALPAPVMAIAATAAVGPGLETLAIALVAFGWPWYARMVRSDILAARQTVYAEAARLSAPGRLFYFLPVALPPLIVAATFDLGNTVLLLSLLSFLGLSDPAPAAELGAMTHDGLGVVLDYPRVALLPMLLVFGMALTASFAGAAFRRVLLRP